MSLFKRTLLRQFLIQTRNPAWGRPGGSGSTLHGPWTYWALRRMMLDEFWWPFHWEPTPDPHADVHVRDLASDHRLASAGRPPPAAKSDILLEVRTPRRGPAVVRGEVPGVDINVWVWCRAPAGPPELVQHQPPQCPAGPGTVRTRSRASRAPQAGFRVWIKNCLNRLDFSPFKKRQAYMWIL